MNIYLNTAVFLTVMFLGFGFWALNCPSGLLERTLLLFSPDGDIQGKTLVWAGHVLHVAGRFLLLSSLAAAIYACVGFLIRDKEPAVVRAAISGGPPGSKEIFLLAGLVLLAVVLRWTPMSRSLSFDEVSLWVNYLKPETIAALFNLWVGNHLGCTFLAWGSVKVFGVSEWALRLPSLIFGAALIVTAGWGLKRVLGVSAWITAFLMALAPVCVIFSASARGYAGAMFFALLVVIFYMEILRSPTRKLMVLLAVCAMAGVLFHPFFVFLLLAQLILLVTVKIGRGGKADHSGVSAAWKALGLAILFTFLVYFPRAVYLWLDFSRSAVYVPQRGFSIDMFAQLLGFSSHGTVLALAIIIIGLWRIFQTPLREAAGAALILSPRSGADIADAGFRALWKLGRHEQAIRVYHGVGRLFWHAEAVGRYYERRGQMRQAVVEYEYLVSEYNKMRKDFLPLPSGPRELFVLGRWYADKDKIKARTYLTTYLAAEKVWSRDPAFRLRHKAAATALLSDM